MKPQSKPSNNLRKLVYLSLFLFAFTYLLSTNGEIHFDSKTIEQIIINDDSIPEEETLYGDTVSYTDGADSIFEINDSIPDSIAMMMDIELTGNIYITFGDATKSINQNQYGIHIGGMFDNSTFPNNGTSDYGWQWLVDLAPESLRFPSGSYSKFMHLLHNTDGSPSVGYGYDIFEIARYFDWTDDTLDFDYDALTTADSNQILFDDPNDLEDWILPSHVPHYVNFRDKWNTQQCETRRYIDDFIDVVNQIDDAYPGKPATRVILDLNILSETATECRAIADTLRARGVNVVGVEMGNETYADFFCDALEFHDFDDYYSFINGTNLTGNINVLQDITGTSNDMWGDHNFITKFKTGGGFNYRIGICGMPLGNHYAFKNIIETCAETDDWNSAIRPHYKEKPIGSSKYKFDAVIMHTYYEPDNWQDFMLDNLDAVTTCTDSSSLWQFDTPDSRLTPSFDSIVGIGNKMGNFRWFLTRNDTVSYMASYDIFNEYFDFDLPEDSAFRKELWVTEWNLKTENKGLDNPVDTTDDADPFKVDAVANTFAHGYMQFQWWLKNIKVNFDNDYANNFFTYSTVQNYAGGTLTDLVSISNSLERQYYSNDTCPYENDCLSSCAFDDKWDKATYHIRRTTYFTTYLISEIYKRNLKYLPSNFYLGTSNLNMQPMVFINPTLDTLYVFNTNVKSSSQNILIEPGDIADLYTGALGVDFYPSTITYLQAKQRYSTSGKGALYDSILNICYDTYDNPFEIKALTETGIDSAIITEANSPECGSGLPYPWSCLTAPPYTIGYFKIPIEPYFIPKKLSETDLNGVSLYPNPTASHFRIKQNIATENEVYSIIKVEIITLTGSIIYSTETNFNSDIDISNLAAGCYLVHATDESANHYYKQIIKTE